MAKSKKDPFDEMLGLDDEESKADDVKVTTSVSKSEKEKPPKITKRSPAIPQYRVTNKVTISWNNQMIRLQPPVIISEATHGPGAIEKMRNSGVALELIEE